MKEHNYYKSHLSVTFIGLRCVKINDENNTSNLTIKSKTLKNHIKLSYRVTSCLDLILTFQNLTGPKIKNSGAYDSGVLNHHLTYVTVNISTARRESITLNVYKLDNLEALKQVLLKVSTENKIQQLQLNQKLIYSVNLFRDKRASTDITLILSIESRQLYPFSLLTHIPTKKLPRLSGKAPGPDNINLLHLKVIGPDTSGLYQFMKSSINQCKFPTEWKI